MALRWPIGRDLSSAGHTVLRGSLSGGSPSRLRQAWAERDLPGALGVPASTAAIDSAGCKASSAIPFAPGLVA